MNRQERQRQSGDDPQKQYQDLRGVRRQQVSDELADVVVDDASLFHGGDDCREIIVGQNHVGSFAADIGSSDPHRDADIRLLQSRRVVYAVSRHRHDAAARRAGPHNPQFMFRRDARIHRRMRSRFDQLGVTQGVQLLAREHPIPLSPESQLLRNRSRGSLMVSGNHHRSDPRAAAMGNRFAHFRPNRVDDRDHSEQHKRRFRLLCLVREIIPIPGTNGHRKHPPSARRKIVGAAPPHFTRCVIERVCCFGALSHSIATGENPLGGSLDEHASIPARRAMQRRHTFAGGTEGSFRQSWPIIPQSCQVNISFHSSADDRRFGRAADDVARQGDLCIVAKHCGFQKCLRGRIIIRLIRKKLGDDHSILRQRAGLVAANDIDRAERFDRRQLPDDRVAPRGAL